LAGRDPRTSPRLRASSRRFRNCLIPRNALAILRPGAAEQALALNPLDGSNEAFFLIAYCGDWERGCALIPRGIELNPHHPRWYELILALNEYRAGQYRQALGELDKANLPLASLKGAILAQPMVSWARRSPPATRCAS